MSSIKQSSHILRRAVLVAAAALAGSLAIAAPSHAASVPQYEFQPIDLTAYDLEDPEPDHVDELRLTVGGASWTGTAGRFGGPNGSVLPRVRFSSSSICMSLTELDASAGEWWSGDDSLGNACVPAGDYTSHHRFAGWGFDYDLRFRVVFLGFVNVPDPLSVTLHCETLGSYRIICDEQTTGGSAPYTVKWYLNGRYLSGKDNQTTIDSGCTANRVNNVTVAVSDAAGASGQRSTSVDCPAYAY